MLEVLNKFFFLCSSPKFSPKGCLIVADDYSVELSGFVAGKYRPFENQNVYNLMLP
jgi:hypothetical protein